MKKPLGQKIGHGQTAELFKWEDDHVIKLFKKGMSEKNAQREASIGGTIYKLGLPVPKVFDVVKLNNRHGIVFEYVSGPTMLQVFSKKPWKVKSLISQFSQLHVAMHRLQPKGLMSQRAEIERLIRKAPLSKERLNKVLAKLVELDDGEVLCHGDFHPDQVILSPSGPRIIDWLTATRGSPAADVATTSLLMRIGALPQGRASSLLVSSARKYAHNQYLARYLKESKVSSSTVESWQIPVAAARLSFRIESEKRHLEKLIDL